jgi:hypothetical protein
MTPVVEWLDQQKDIDCSFPITMHAMGRIWLGAVYTVDWDLKRPCIYLLGRMPTNAINLCFRFPDEEIGDLDWYVASYFQENLDTLEPHQLKYHPFGKSWILQQWTHEERIDHHQDKKCKRIQARITWN